MPAEKQYSIQTRAIASKFGRHNSPRRAPTGGAPTNCQSFSDKKPAFSRQRRMEFAIAHNDLHSSRRYALRRAPTRGAPTYCLLSAFCPEKGAHKGRPYRLSFSTFGPGKGTHKGCPYRLASLGVLPWEGHPQGVPLPIGFSRRLALGRAPTRGTPTNCLLSAFGPGKGAHKGCLYRLASLGVLPCEGHPQGVPLPIGFSRRFALRRAPTRGAPTDWLLSAFCPAKGTHKGCPYRLASLGVLPCEGHPQGVPLPIAFSRRFALGRASTRGAPTDCLLSTFGPGKGAHKGRPYLIVFSWRFGPGEGAH